MSETESLVQAWRVSADAVTEVTAGLDAEHWALPTDCPGWSVRDVLAHLTHIDGVLAGDPDPAAEEAPDGRTVVGPDYTGRGVAAFADLDPERLRRDWIDVVERRAALLDPPPDPADEPSTRPGGVGWDVVTLLRNRAIDAWVHEQDLRRALRRPGGMDTPGAELVVRSFGSALGFVLGKRVKAPVGTVLALEVRGPVPFASVVRVDDDGRARPADAGTPATATVLTDTETFAMLGAGRRDPRRLAVRIDGDQALGDAVLTRLAVTP